MGNKPSGCCVESGDQSAQEPIEATRVAADASEQENSAQQLAAEVDAGEERPADVVEQPKVQNVQVSANEANEVVVVPAQESGAPTVEKPVALAVQEQTERTPSKQALDGPISQMRKSMSEMTPLTHQKSNWSKACDDTESVLEVHNVNFAVKTKNGPKKILDSISLKVRSKEPLGLMGPSGAGKTTLLELLTMDLRGKATGRVTLNGVDFTYKTFVEYCAFVEQYDSHRAFLTCREILTYAAEVCIADKKTIKGQVDDLLDHLGLTRCADTRAGNMFVKGISGGQKKRLSLGMLLLKRPKVLFLDEPTSGLDAASAEHVMMHVFKTAVEAHMIVVATIHSPQTSVFLGFGNMCFLTNGRMAYHGPPGDVTQFCAEIGKPVPEMTNPADHFLELINASFMSKEEVDKVVSAFRSNVHLKEVEASHVKRQGSILVLAKRPSAWSMSLTFLRRQGLNSIRDPSIYLGRAVLFLVAQSMFSIVYIKQRERTQQQAEPKLFLNMWLSSVPAMFSMAIVIACNEDFKMKKKEIKNGLGSCVSALLADVMLQIPYMALLSICTLLVPMNLVANFAIAGLPAMFAVLTIYLWCFEAMGEVNAMIHSNPLVGMLSQANLWFCTILFGGIFLSPDEVPWPLRVLTYCFPLRWAIRTFLYIEFDKGGDWSGAVRQPGGYITCDNPRYCYGVTGKEVLNSLSKYYGALDDEDHFVMDILLVFGIGCVFKLTYIILFILKTKTTPVLQADPESKSSAPGTDNV